MKAQKDLARHDDFYVDTVVFQVDNTIFKVPSRYFHEKSEAFATAAKISTENPTGEGSSDANPIKLSPLPHGTRAKDFALLTKVVMSLTFNLTASFTYTLTQWVSVLKLATAWEFNDIRTLAMKSITDHKDGTYEEWFATFEFCWNLAGFTELRAVAIIRVDGLQKWTPVQKVHYGRGYWVRRWVSEGLRELILAPTLPDAKDIESLGLQTVVIFLVLREQAVKRCMPCKREGTSRRSNYSGPSYLSDSERCSLADVENHFSEELSLIKPPI
ncbi:hypothetical protein L218DRAFT_512615 [Marasmius fiardii PR-910]|nr:hypothetical protein L218DRAFT_512615 [Marasmius fiardii PR-910]